MRHYLLKLLLFLLLIPTTGDNAVAGFFFSSSGYKENVKVESFLTTTSEVARFFGKEADSSTKSDDSLGCDLNLVVRIMNIGSKAVWGTLKCDVKGYQVITIHVPHLVPNMKEPRTFVVPLSGMIKPRKKVGVTTTWDKLSTK